MTFSELNLNEKLLEALSYMKFETATPIQEQAIPKILEGKDLIACAQTGTGKTAAFMLPVLHLLSEKPHRGIRALILVPTRELATQIDNEIQGFSYFLDLHSCAIYGGGSGIDFEREKNALKSGVDIVVATPGRLMSMLNMGIGNFKTLEFLILDEADRMLDMGFLPDITRILSFLPKQRQNLMFSATMAPKIRKLAHDLLHEPAEVTLSVSKTAEGVTQAVYPVDDAHKVALIDHIITNRPNYNSIIVFCSRKNKVNDVVRQLQRKKLKVAGISSDVDQNEREDVLRQFKAKNINILVATDVMSRGIDIKDINLVVNFDTPNQPEDYVHRVGRTARAETKGEAITLVSGADAGKFFRIESLLKTEIPKLEVPKEIGPTLDLKAQPHRPRFGRGPGRQGGNRNGRPFKKRNKPQGSQHPRKENPNKG